MFWVILIYSNMLHNIHTGGCSAARYSLWGPGSGHMNEWRLLSFYWRVWVYVSVWMCVCVCVFLYVCALCDLYTQWQRSEGLREALVSQVRGWNMISAFFFCRLSFFLTTFSFFLHSYFTGHLSRIQQHCSIMDELIDRPEFGFITQCMSAVNTYTEQLYMPLQALCSPNSIKNYLNLTLSALEVLRSRRKAAKINICWHWKMIYTQVCIYINWVLLQAQHCLFFM